MKDVFPFYSIGHFINQPNNTTTFEWLSFDQMEEPAVDDYHKHTFYEILWTEAGKSKQTIDFKEYEVNPHTLFFISPNQVHHFEEWKPLLGGTILFTEDFYLLNQRNKNNLLELSFLDSFYANPCVVFDAKDFEKILHIIRQIGIEQQRPDRNLLIIQSYLHILLAEVQRHLDNTNDMDRHTKKYLVQFKQFKAMLEQHFSAHKTSSFYAQQMHITPHHLNVICKNMTNCTATDIIRARLVLEAQRLLCFTNKTVSEIAFALNFSDSSYFAKTFKAVTQQSPQQFKAEMSEKYRTR